MSGGRGAQAKRCARKAKLVAAARKLAPHKLAKASLRTTRARNRLVHALRRWVGSRRGGVLDVAEGQVRGFKRRPLAQAEGEAGRTKRRLSAFAKALRAGEPLHANKFIRVGGVLTAKVPPVDLSWRLSVLHPRGWRPQYTLVYLHQFCNNGADYVDYKPHYFFSATKLPDLSLRVVLPTAQAMPITAHGGQVQYTWYDYFSDYGGAREDELCRRTLRETRDRIFHILDREVELLGGDASRVFIGGASQGCGTALHCALQYPRTLGGFVGFVGHLLTCSPLPRSRRRLPIFLYNGKEDHVMRWRWVRSTYSRFKAAGYKNVHVKVEDGVAHGTPSRKERDWILNFLTKRIPRKGGAA